MTKSLQRYESFLIFTIFDPIMSVADNNKIMRRRLANAYLSSVISISLVLLLVGMASMLLVNAKSVSDYFKENMQISVMMKQNVSESDAMAYKNKLDKQRYINLSPTGKFKFVCG